MFYDYSFEIPANTTEARPERQDISLTHGIINRVEVGFPGGCVGMVHLIIRHGLHQLWPTNPDGSFNANRYNIPFSEYYPLLTEPYILNLYGWSPGTAHNHTLEIRIGILPEEVLMPEVTFISAFKKLLTRLRL